jgi:hypothetical protein
MFGINSSKGRWGILAAFVLMAGCGPSDDDLKEAVIDHMVRQAMAEGGTSYHALEVQLITKGDEKDGVIPLKVAVSGAISADSGADEMTAPTPFADTLELSAMQRNGRWEVM